MCRRRDLPAARRRCAAYSGPMSASATENCTPQGLRLRGMPPGLASVVLASIFRLSRWFLAAEELHSARAVLGSEDLATSVSDNRLEDRPQPQRGRRCRSPEPWPYTPRTCSASPLRDWSFSSVKRPPRRSGAGPSQGGEARGKRLRERYLPHRVRVSLDLNQVSGADI